MKQPFAVRLQCLFSVFSAALLMTACFVMDEAGQEVNLEGTLVVPEVTANAALAGTLQAEAAATAAWVVEQQPSEAATPAPVETIALGEAPGVSPTDRRGPCPVPDGYELHLLQGFCIATPTTWVSRNMDGGIAATLGTTPGQVISLQPSWAAAANVCNLTIYIASEFSAVEHLEPSHAEFSRHPDLVEVSPITMLSLGEMALPGFTWSLSDGSSGGVFADSVGINRLVHIGYGGTDCTPEDLAPALNTMRFD